MEIVEHLTHGREIWDIVQRMISDGVPSEIAFDKYLVRQDEYIEELLNRHSKRISELPDADKYVRTLIELIAIQYEHVEYIEYSPLYLIAKKQFLKEVYDMLRPLRHHHLLKHVFNIFFDIEPHNDNPDKLWVHYQY